MHVRADYPHTCIWEGRFMNDQEPTLSMKFACVTRSLQRGGGAEGVSSGAIRIRCQKDRTRCVRMDVTASLRVLPAML